MKKLTMSLLTLTLIMFLCGAAYATEFEARGSAVVTGVRTNYVSSSSSLLTNIVVTNISGSDVDCRITVYNHAGDDVTSVCTVYSGPSSDNSLELIASGTGSFALPAGATRMLMVQATNTNISTHILGHAVIEWGSEDTHVRKALIAALETAEFRTSQRRSFGRSINGGQPF